MGVAASRVLGVPGLSAILLCLLAVYGGSTAPPARPDLRVVNATGAMTIGNDRENKAVLSASGLVPGGAALGRVTIAAGGASVTLSAARPEDNPGPGGGLLSGRLMLRITDVTNASSPRLVFFGALAHLPATDLGIAPGRASRTYEFSVAFPDAPSQDLNAYMASSTSVDFSWDAVILDPAPSGDPAQGREALPGANSADPPVEAAPAEPGSVPGDTVEVATARRPTGSHDGAMVVANTAGGFSVSANLAGPTGRGLFTGRYTAGRNGGVLTWKLTLSGRPGPVIARIRRGRAGPVLVSLCARCPRRGTGTVRISKAVRMALETGKAYLDVRASN